MAAREFHGIIHNTLDNPLMWNSDDCDSGQWQEPFLPSKTPGAGRIEPQQSGEWRSESDGFMTGTSGWARWSIRVSGVSEAAEHFEYVQVNWSIPFNQIFSRVDITYQVFRNNPDPHDAFAVPDPKPPLLELVPSAHVEGGGAFPTGEDDRNLPVLAQAGTIIGTLFIPNATIVEHAIVPFVLRRRQTDQTQGGITQAPQHTKGLVYAITPTVEGTVQVTGTGTRASGGDLLWARHLGRNDGSFKWEGPEKVGVGWGRFKHVFSGGDGIIYAITPVVEASVHITGETTPASGGDLWWYRHVGREDGSFAWEGPKKVGTGWGELEHVFSGGNGIIYAITPLVEARVHITGGTTPASGGDLMWFRHLGRDDGTFRWDGPKKVGTGWSAFTQAFSGGDGIIYGITPVVEARVHIADPTTPASGGDLMWFRHLGREDGTFRWDGPKKVGSGWGPLQHVFSGGDGFIYAITPLVEASVHITGRTTPASGGDLVWGHHIGREDGTFRWEGSLKKVGTGWGKLGEAFSGD
jgi:hypothetical protein